jgi:hypothetical protein
MWQPRSVQVEQDAADAYARELVTVEAERAAYRSGIPRAGRQAERARSRQPAKVREKGWCDNLPSAGRAERPTRAGLDELDQYQTWLRAVPPDEYVARSLKRKQRFQDLSRRTRRVGRRVGPAPAPLRTHRAATRHPGRPRAALHT